LIRIKDAIHRVVLTCHGHMDPACSGRAKLEMGRGRWLDEIARIARMARFADRHGLDSRTASADFAAEVERARLSRRALLRNAGVAAVGLGLTSLGRRAHAAAAPSTRVSIIGGGLSALSCADTLAKSGLAANIYEAHPYRLGGRVLSDRDTFAPQVAEAGGELIDNLHKTMLGYARELGLTLEDLGKAPGAPTFFFGGQHYSEAEVVDEYRVLVERMRPDMQTLSGAPTFYANNGAGDVILDHTPLADYLASRAHDLPLVRRVLDVAYNIEYGLETSEQSTLNMLFFLHLDRAGHFREFGVYSDERYHIVEGNDAIIQGLAARVPGNKYLGARLTALSKQSDGFHLSFANSAFDHVADAVVCTIPFSALRGVALDDAALGLSADKRRAIDELGYGTNAKTMIGFDYRHWAALGYSGSAYSDLPNIQNVWETNYSVGAPLGILTDYSGGTRGRALQLAPPPAKKPKKNDPPPSPFDCGSCHEGSPYASQLNPTGSEWVDAQAEAFLADLDQVWPGVQAAATRTVDGNLVVRRGHWLPQSFSKGSYTCYKPGQFTSIAGLESEPCGGLKFAGEHTDSFYEWQGFMEGACNSGIRAAGEILEDIKWGRLPR